MEIEKIKRILEGCYVNQEERVLCNSTVGLCRGCLKYLEKQMRLEMKKLKKSATHKNYKVNIQHTKSCKLYAEVGSPVSGLVNPLKNGVVKNKSAEFIKDTTEVKNE